MRVKGGLERMFMGEYTHSLDDKGRLTIPVKFRAQLAQGAVITRGFEKYLLIYTGEAFQKLTERASALSPTDPNHRALLRLAFSGASEAEPDKNGRIILPPFLRSYAEIETECVIVGVGEYIEVWSRAGWEEQLRQVNDPDTNAQRFAALNLSIRPDDANTGAL